MLANMAASTISSLQRTYALAVVAGRERATRERILERLERAGMDTTNLVITCPDEEVIVDKGTPERHVERKLTLPGYLLISARKLSETMIVTIANVNGVMSFLGGDDNPKPLSHQEVEHMMGSTGTGTSSTTRHAGPTWQIGQEVQVTEGPLSDFRGAISGINEGQDTATVDIEIFGRQTPTQVPFRHLRKA
jgi:transcriptional antiterminator NusG